MTYDTRRARSVSQLKTYSECGKKFELTKIDRHPSAPAAWTARGIAVHGVVEEWEKSDRTADPGELYDKHWKKAVQELTDKWPDLDTWIRTPRVKSTEQDLKLRRQDGLDQLFGSPGKKKSNGDPWMGYIPRALAEANLWMPHRLPDGRLAVELSARIDFGPDYPFFLIAYIDIVKYWRDSAALTVGDFKTGSDAGESYIQLGTYRIALAETYGIEADWGELIYPKLDRTSGWIDLRRYTKEYLAEQYSRLDTGVEAGVFIANPNKANCKMFCGVRQHCPEMRDR